MKKTLFKVVLLLLTLLLPFGFIHSCSSGENAIRTESKQTAYKMHKGINVSTWLCHTDARSGSEAEGAFTQNDLNELAKMGFDHIRLPIDEKLLYRTSGLERDETTFRLIHDIIGWCDKAGMTIAINFHIPKAGKKVISSAGSQEERNRIVAVWKDLSSEFGTYPNELVAYELYNEPNFGSDDLWNDFAADMIGCIRENEPGRIIILAPNGNNAIDKLPALRLPADKENIIVSFHFYQPAVLTHYGVGRLKNIAVGLQYPGTIFPEGALDGSTEEEKAVLKLFNGTFDTQTLTRRLLPAVEFAKTNGIRIRCGEYGCNDAYEKTTGDKDLKVRWFTDLVGVFDKLGIPHCLWGTRATFGLFDDNGKLNDPRVVTAITGYKE